MENYNKQALLKQLVANVKQRELQTSNNREWATQSTDASGNLTPARSANQMASCNTTNNRTKLHCLADTASLPQTTSYIKAGTTDEQQNNLADQTNQRTYLPRVTIVGAGAAGYFLTILLACHPVAVTLVDMGKSLGRKIKISGGGNCNFTNLDVTASNYRCHNPHFVKSALSGFSNWDFISFVAKHNLSWHTKDDSKLYATHGAQDLLNIFNAELQARSLRCPAFKLKHLWQTQITDVVSGQEIITDTNQTITGDVTVIATGGLAMPRLQVSEVSKSIALLNANYITTNPGLVPLVLAQRDKSYTSLSGVSLPVAVTVPGFSANDMLLFTHRGISGPLVLTLSNYLTSFPTELQVNWLPNIDMQAELLMIQQQAHSNAGINAVRKKLSNYLITYLPQAVVELWHSKDFPEIRHLLDKQIAQLNRNELTTIGNFINNGTLKVAGRLGYDKAEVMLGGVNTDLVSSKTLAVKKDPRLYVIGEALDVTGDLGGYNFQWCWSSAYATYKAICQQLHLGEPQPLV